MNVRDLIYDAMRLCGVLNAGEGQNVDENNESLRALNTMIDSWNTERLIIYSIGRHVYNFTGAESYTLGPDGDWIGNRPLKIDNAGLVLLNNPSQPLELPLDCFTKDQYAAIRIKNLISVYPLCVYDDRSFPLTRLHFWPIPTPGLSQVALYTWEPISAFGDLTDFVNMPPGFLEAITYNLALRLAPRYTERLNPMVIEIAKESKGNVKRLNAQAPVLIVDSALLNTPGSVFDYRIGDFRRRH